jgi:hypothetical protein
MSQNDPPTGSPEPQLGWPDKTPGFAPLSPSSKASAIGESYAKAQPRDRFVLIFYLLFYQAKSMKNKNYFLS